MTASILDDPDVQSVRSKRKPRGAGGGSLYVIEIGTDRIKVGWSGNPTARLKSHRAAAHAYGTGAGREWVSPARAGLVTETALIDFCAARATEQLAREFFVGVRFEDAVEHATALTVDPLDIPAAIEQVLVHVMPGATLRDLLDVPLSEIVREGQAVAFFVRDGDVSEYQPEVMS